MRNYINGTINFSKYEKMQFTARVYGNKVVVKVVTDEIMTMDEFIERFLPEEAYADTDSVYDDGSEVNTTIFVKDGKYQIHSQSSTEFVQDEITKDELKQLLVEGGY